MTVFEFRAARPDGESLTGAIDAVSAAAAADLVAERGLFPIEIHARPAPRRNAAAPEDLATALAGLAALLEAGLPVDRALAALEDTSPAPLREALRAARERVREGTSLSQALAAQGAVPDVVIGLLRSGERTGRLAAAVAHAAGELEREAETRASVRAALTYPAFLAVAGTVSVIAIAGFVVPRFAALLDAHGAALPTTTRALLAVSTVVSRFAVPFAVALASAAVAAVRWYRTEAGALAAHRALLEVPFIGSLRLRFATARASGALAGLLGSGVPALAALDLSALAGGDRALAVRMAATREDVSRGERLGSALRRHRALSPLALRLAEFGDLSGKLPAFLAHAARIEERSAQRSLKRAVSLLEPLLIVGFGGVVAFVALALLQAVYSVRPGVVP